MNSDQFCTFNPKPSQKSLKPHKDSSSKDLDQITNDAYQQSLLIIREILKPEDQTLMPVPRKLSSFKELAIKLLD